MKNIFRYSATPVGAIMATCALIVALASFLLMSRAGAASTDTARDGRLVTIHDRGTEKVILTHAQSIKDALSEANINLDAQDTIEPALDEKLVATDYTVNIYRARPVIVVDGALRQKVMTPYQTADKIAEDAGIELHDEDKTTIAPSKNIVSDGAGLEMTIDRAVPFTLVLYGQKTQAYTQEATVGAMLKEKKIKLGTDDTLSAPETTSMTANMTVEIWRNGKQTATEEKEIPFDTEKVQDADKEVGFREVKTPGVKGKRSVTYEIEMKNGKEISRKEIQSVVIEQPKKQVEIVGAKPNVPTNPGEAAKLGHQMMLAYGFGEDQWSCLYNLWQRESGWKTTAGNPSSGAYGIPQALPGSKMGPGWQNDAAVQIRWGLGYIKGRYNNPCGAWSAFLSKGWY